MITNEGKIVFWFVKVGDPWSNPLNQSRYKIVKILFKNMKIKLAGEVQE